MSLAATSGGRTSSAATGVLCTLFVDTAQRDPAPAELEWYEARLPRDAGPLLAAMCGSGRHLAALAARRWSLHGADASAPMLARCETRLASVGVKAPLFRQDPAALNLPFRYAGAFVAAGAFQSLPDPHAAQTALERIRAHLVNPGVLLLDLFVPAQALHPPGAPQAEVRSVALDDGTRIAQRCEMYVDAEARRIDYHSRYEHRAGAAVLAREDERRAITWYAEDEIVALLRDAGYRDVVIAESSRAADPDIPEGERRFSVASAA